MPRRKKKRRVSTEIPPVYKCLSLSYDKALEEFPFLTREAAVLINKGGRTRSVDGVRRYVKAQLGLDYTRKQVRLVLEAFHVESKGTTQYRRKEEQRKRAEALMRRRLHKHDLKKNFGDQLVKKIYV